eukprot:FN608190.1.p1 GENE.FN608190.1~~FN608190.1.p1  ORF type:complete len:55 (-),score=0.92 FN608190.1:45-179(-)
MFIKYRGRSAEEFVNGTSEFLDDYAAASNLDQNEKMDGASPPSS